MAVTAVWVQVNSISQRLYWPDSFGVLVLLENSVSEFLFYSNLFPKAIKSFSWHRNVRIMGGHADIQKVLVQIEAVV